MADQKEKPVSYTHLDVYKRQLSGIDGSVDEKTTISDVYDLYQSNPIAAENKLEDRYVIICDTVSSVSKNGDGDVYKIQGFTE